MILTIRTAILCLLIGLLHGHSFAIKPDRVYRCYPEKMGLVYKELEVTTPDGLKIKTWFFPAQSLPSEQELDESWQNPLKKAYKTQSDSPRPTLIIANGDAGNMSYQQLFHAQFFTNQGYNVVTFDWRGFGESSLWEMNENYLVYSELLIDYDAVIQAVLQQKEVDTNRLAVYGWSTGAYLSMAAAEKYDNIKAFVAIGLITTFEEVLPVLQQSTKKGLDQLIVPSDYPMQRQPRFLAPNFTKSTLLIVGENDNRSPVWMSEKVCALLPSQKELWVVEGAEHGGSKGPLRDFDVFHQRVLAFLASHL